MLGVRESVTFAAQSLLTRGFPSCRSPIACRTIQLLDCIVLYHAILDRGQAGDLGFQLFSAESTYSNGCPLSSVIAVPLACTRKFDGIRSLRRVSDPFLAHKERSVESAETTMIHTFPGLVSGLPPPPCPAFEKFRLCCQLSPRECDLQGPGVLSRGRSLETELLLGKDCSPMLPFDTVTLPASISLPSGSTQV